MLSMPSTACASKRRSGASCCFPMSRSKGATKTHLELFSSVGVTLAPSDNAHGEHKENAEQTSFKAMSRSNTRLVATNCALERQTRACRKAPQVHLITSVSPRHPACKQEVSFWVARTATLLIPLKTNVRFKNRSLKEPSLRTFLEVDTSSQTPLAPNPRRCRARAPTS